MTPEATSDDRVELFYVPATVPPGRAERDCHLAPTAHPDPPAVDVKRRALDRTQQRRYVRSIASKIGRPTGWQNGTSSSARAKYILARAASHAINSRNGAEGWPVRKLSIESPKCAKVFPRQITSPHASIFRHIAQDVGQLEGATAVDRQVLRPLVGVSPDRQAAKAHRSRDVIAVIGKIFERIETLRVEIAFDAVDDVEQILTRNRVPPDHVRECPQHRMRQRVAVKGLSIRIRHWSIEGNAARAES